MRTTLKERCEVIARLNQIGIPYDDARALRRISMTLRRWFELECGDGNNYGSWAIERDDNGDGPPYMVHHHYAHGQGKDTVTRTRIADRESGARKRLEKILVKYPTLTPHIQTDPRGCALYILTQEQLEHCKGMSLDSIYNNGIAVY